MTVADAVSLACQNQALVVKVLAGMGASSIVMSPVAWLAARYNAVPAPYQRVLQALAINLLHAVLGEPVPPPLPPSQAVGAASEKSSS